MTLIHETVLRKPAFRPEPARRMDWRQSAINIGVWVVIPGLFWWTVIRALMPTVH